MKGRVRPSKKYIPVPVKENQTKAERSDIIFQLEQRASILYRNNQFNSSGIYQASATSLKRYCDTLSKKSLTFRDVTSAFLSEYESWMLINGKQNKSATGPGEPCSVTTVRMYIQAIKWAFMRAVEGGVIGYDKLPFAGKDAYVAPGIVPTREPRTKLEVQQIIDLRMDNETDQFFKDMWVFSYLSNGMNAKDICLLRKTDINIKKMSFSFFREKTRTSQRSARKQISGALLDQSVEIIKKWTPEGSDYLFPVFKKGMSQLEMESAKKYFILRVNRTMKKVGEILGIHGDLRTYVARHSFTNVLLQQDVPLAYISSALGHSRITSTQTYTGKFRHDKVHDYTSKLI